MTKAVILAGGLGTRLRHVVSDVPKPMAPIHNKPFLAHQMDHWMQSGIDSFILSVGYLRETIIDYFGDCYNGVPITYAIEEIPLGTGGGILQAMKHLNSDDSFLLLNGDTYFDVDLIKLKELHCRHNAGVTFSLFRANEPDRFGGVSIDANCRITKFRSEKARSGQLANGGVYMIDPNVIRKQYHADVGKFSFEDDILPRLFDTGTPFFGLESNGRFVDIGVPEDYAAASIIMFR